MGIRKIENGNQDTQMHARDCSVRNTVSFYPLGPRFHLANRTRRNWDRGLGVQATHCVLGLAVLCIFFLLIAAQRVSSSD